jgi:hypothetical protein
VNRRSDGLNRVKGAARALAPLAVTQAMLASPELHRLLWLSAALVATIPCPATACAKQPATSREEATRWTAGSEMCAGLRPVR